MSACSLLERSAGRFFGPHTPYQDTNAKPFTPDSSTVGMSGAAAARLRLVRPSALILPPCASGAHVQRRPLLFSERPDFPLTSSHSRLYSSTGVHPQILVRCWTGRFPCHEQPATPPSNPEPPAAASGRAGSRIIDRWSPDYISATASRSAGPASGWRGIMSATNGTSSR